MFDRAALKNDAKAKLKNNWGMAIATCLIYGLMVGVISAIGYIPVIGLAAIILLIPPFMVGLNIAFLRFVKFGGEPEIKDLFAGFNPYGKSLGTVLWMELWIILWSILFVIPGIVKSIAYSQTIFILADNPTVNPTEALKISMRMTNGCKWSIFVTYLSFLGWALLCCITFGIGYIWLCPYIQTTMANLYLKLKEMSISSGACHLSEFGV